MYGKNSSIIDDIRNQFRHGSMTNRLILINLFVFVGLILLKIIFQGFMQNQALYETIKSFIVLPSGMNFLFKPWTLFTYMFVHEGFIHLLFNLVVLYWFGSIFSIFLNDKKLLPIYIYGGLAGGLTYLLFANLLPMGGMLLGASAGIMAIVFAVTTLNPDYVVRLMFIGDVRLKYIALALIVFDLAGIAFMNNTGGHLAHLGGGLMGFIFTKQLQNGNDLAAPLNRFFDRLSGSGTPVKKARPQVVYRRNPSQANTASPPPRRTRTRVNPNNVTKTGDQQSKIDEILDKISTSGYDSLSKEEKEFLFRLRDDD